MKRKEEGYKLLNYKGVDLEIQQLFSSIIHEDETGKITFFYKDMFDRFTDEESFTLTKLKYSSKGIVICCHTNSKTIMNIYLSTSCMNLIAFANLYSKRLDFGYSAFISLGIKPDKALFLNELNKINPCKISCLFGNGILGRVMDCKVAHWVRGEERSFLVEKKRIVSTIPNGTSDYIPRDGFSLRNYFRKIGGRMKVNTYKPGDRTIDNFIDMLLLT